MMNLDAEASIVKQNSTDTPFSKWREYFLFSYNDANPTKWIQFMTNASAVEDQVIISNGVSSSTAYSFN